MMKGNKFNFEIFQKLKNWHVLILLLIYWIIIGFQTGAVLSGFHLWDDFHFIYLEKLIKNRSLLDIAMNWNTGRFVPIYKIFVLVLTYLYGTYFQGHSITMLFLGLFANIIIYFSFRNFKLSTIESLIFSAVILIGLQSHIWYKLSIAEPFGVLFFSIAFFAISMNFKNNKLIYNLLFLISATLMSLSKESFVLFLPAMICFHFMVKHKLEMKPMSLVIKQNILSYTFLILVFIWEIIYILLFVKMKSVGTGGIDFELGYLKILKMCIGLVSFSSFYLTVLAAFIYLFMIDMYNGFNKVVNNKFVYLILVIILVTFFTYRFRFLKDFRFIIPFLLIVIIYMFLLIKILKNLKLSIIFIGFIIVALLPQYFLHLKSGFQDRYIFPMVIGIVLSCFLLYTQIKSIDYKKKLLNILLFTLVLFVLISYKNAVGYAREGQDTNKMMKYIKENYNDKVLIVANSLSYIDWGMSFKEYLNKKLSINNIWYLRVLKSPTDSDKKSYERRFCNLEYIYKDYTTNITQVNKFDLIVVFPELNNSFRRSWDGKNYKINNFGEFTVYKKMY